VVIVLSKIPSLKFLCRHIIGILEGGYHPLNNENFMIFCKGDFHPLTRQLQYGWPMNQPMNSSIQHQPLVARFSASSEKKSVPGMPEKCPYNAVPALDFYRGP